MLGLAVTSGFGETVDHGYLLNPTDDGRYTVVDLGHLGGSRTVPDTVNDAGQVVGWAYRAIPENCRAAQRPFLWTESQGIRDLDIVPMPLYSTAGTINSHGQVVGMYKVVEGGPKRVFLWTESEGMRDLGTLGAESIWTVTINDHGTIVGMGDLAGFGAAAFVWTEAQGIQPLADTPDTFRTVLGINNRGEAFGWSNSSASGLYWSEATGVVEMGVPDGFESAYAVDLNNVGQVVGTTRQDPEIAHGFVWTLSNGFQDMGPLLSRRSQARAINDHGVVVGGSSLSGLEQAFVWRDGVLANLTDLIPPNTPGKLITATDINNLGQITVYLEKWRSSTIRVPEDFPTIQAAIDAACRNQVIVVGPGIWTGPGNMDLVVNKTVTFRSEMGPRQTIIDCGGAGRAFHFSTAPASVIEGFTITNGVADRGGAIYSPLAGITITDCILTNNSADLTGGAIHIGNSSIPVIKRCAIVNNSAGDRGGAVFLDGANLRILNSTVADNTAGEGGGISIEGGRVTMRDSIVWGNAADAGPAVELRKRLNLGAALIVATIVGFAQSFTMVTMAMTLLGATSPEIRGRVMGLRSLAVYGLPVGLLASGATADAFGASTALLINGAVGVTVAIAISLWLRRLWKHD